MAPRHACRRMSPAAAFSLALALPYQYVSAGLPQVDFDRMGRVVIAGSFAGIDVFDSTSKSAATFDISTSTLLSRAADGSLTPLGSTNSGGRVVAGCTLGDTSYFGGTFTTIGGIAARNIASYSSSSGLFSPLGGANGGLDSDVLAVYCDTSAGNLWVGGGFHGPVTDASGFAGAVAVYHPRDNKWSPPPFAGLTGASQKVSSITPSLSGSSLYFAGSFLTAFQSTSVTINGTRNPNVPTSPGATIFSTSLVPIPLANDDIQASPSSASPVFADIKKILCPSGADGPGQSWRSADGAPAHINVRTYRQLTASGLRLGNSFVDGASTTTFSVASIPDNKVLTLRFTDPATQTQSTCSDRCPLSIDPSIPFQDFLFDSQSLTGVLINLYDWKGVAPGLHLLQLLSDGAFASAVNTANGDSCFAPNPSSSLLSGTWTSTDVVTGVPGTVQTVMISNVQVGSPASSAPSITWKPYVSASGVYDIFITVPGCVNTQDCGARTSVKLTVLPGQNLDPVTTIFSQRVDQDKQQLVYSGPIIPSNTDFTISITLTIADVPDGTGEGGQYRLIADRVILLLKSSDTAGGDNSSSGSGSGARRGFGILEWSLSDTQPVNASSVLPNTTQTALDTAGFQLFSAIGNSAASAASMSLTSVAGPPSEMYLAGNFTLPTGPANIIAFKATSLSPLSEGGLNGPVSAMAMDGDTLFVGGSFTDTSSGGTGNRYLGIARYNVISNQWAPLNFGLNGPVTDLIVSNGQVIVAGSFTRILTSSSPTSGYKVGGIACWDIKGNEWVPSGGFLAGSTTLVTNSGDNQKQFVAGNILGSRKFGSDGLVMLSNGNNGPSVKTLGSRLGDFSDFPPQSPPPQRRRSDNSNWVKTMRTIFPRQNSAAPALIPPLPTPAPAVLAGAFWTNTTSSSQLVIFGGNFSFPSITSSQAVALYDPSSGKVTPLRGNQINGTVMALLVVGDRLYIGGEFTLSGVQGGGMAIYDLALQQWDLVGFQAPRGSGNVVVRSLQQLPSYPNIIAVAGSFTGVGSASCNGICLFDTAQKQWSVLGAGVNAEISSISFAGTDSDLLIAAGSIVFPDKTVTSVAQYSITNGTWTTVGPLNTLPGPVSAVGVNALNQSSIFVAGQSADGQSPFLSYWDGSTWSNIKAGLKDGSRVTQLAIVPLTEEHGASGAIQSNRMLLLSGSLISDSFGTVSSALYDGEQFYPYLATSTISGTPGLVASLFHSFTTFSFDSRRFLAMGVVILVSIAIGAGIVFFLLLIGVLWTLLSRRDERDATAEPIHDEDDDSFHRPSSLLAHINAATRTTILGTPKDAELFSNTPKHEEMAMEKEHHHDGDGSQAADTPFEGVISADEEDVNRPAHARYSFDGSGEGELSLAAGAEVIVLNDSDPAWWFVRDANTLREGVVPAAYLY